MIFDMPEESRGQKHPHGEAIKPFWSLVPDTSGSRARRDGRGLRPGDDCGRSGQVCAYASTKYGPVVADVFPGCGPIAGIHGRARAFFRRYESNARRGYALDFRRTSDLSLHGGRKQQRQSPVHRTKQGLSATLCDLSARTLASAERALRAGKYKIDAAFAGVSVRCDRRRRIGGGGFFRADVFQCEYAAGSQESIEGVSRYRAALEPRWPSRAC